MNNRYKTYAPEIKKQIMESGNINLFPALKIPRSTARYWIEKAKPIMSERFIDNGLKARISKLERDLVKERSKTFLLSEFVNSKKWNEKKINDKYKAQIVQKIMKYRAHIGQSECLRLLKIPRSTFYRWKHINHICKISGIAVCAKTKGMQLTLKEQEVLSKMVLSRRYSHMSIKSLHLYCLRHNILCCALDTWYRYIKKLSLKRLGRAQKKIKKYEIGIRTKSPNQLWHVDVTRIKLKSGMTAYLQVIIDNFSRYIIGWKISENINAAMTVDTIKQALITKNAPHAFMMDAGTENVNRSVLKILVHENVKRIIAKQTIHWSNSMVEAFFRSLKNNYLYARTSQTFTELNRRLSYYFKQHNEVIPHSSLGGAVPIEVYKSIWNETKRDNLMQSIQTGLLNRIKFNKELVCCLHGR